MITTIPGSSKCASSWKYASQRWRQWRTRWTTSPSVKSLSPPRDFRDRRQYLFAPDSIPARPHFPGGVRRSPHQSGALHTALFSAGRHAGKGSCFVLLYFFFVFTFVWASHHLGSLEREQNHGAVRILASCRISFLPPCVRSGYLGHTQSFLLQNKQKSKTSRC